MNQQSLPYTRNSPFGKTRTASKAYSLTATSVNEEVSNHVSLVSNAFEALKKLKELYDSHSTLEVVQLMIKLFSL